MVIIDAIVTKVMFILLFMSILFVIRETFFFVRYLILMLDPQPYKIKTNRLIYLGLSLSYIITSIITGI